MGTKIRSTEVRRRDEHATDIEWPDAVLQADITQSEYSTARASHNELQRDNIALRRTDTVEGWPRPRGVGTARQNDRVWAGGESYNNTPPES